MSITKRISVALGALLALTPGVALGAPVSSVPDTAALAGDLAHQELSWGPCTFATPGQTETYKDTTQCAKVTVPRDWHNPGNGETFQIAISRAGNVDPSSDAYRGTLFINPGGPGGSGLVWSGVIHAATPELHASHNYIGFDPRGVGQSSRVSCEFSYDSSDKYGWHKAVAETCGKDKDVQTITTEQTAYDMDFIRHLLGVKKLSFLGYSYGTWLGTWYGSLFGANAESLILDSAMDVTAPSMERNADLQLRARDRQFREHLMNWIARHDETYGLGTDPAAIYRRYLAGQKKMNPRSLSMLWMFSEGDRAFVDRNYYPKAANVVRSVASYAASTASTTSSGNPARDALRMLKKQRGDAIDGAEDLANLPTVDESKRVTDALTSPYYFVTCQDGQYNQDIAAQEAKVAKGKQAYPLSNEWGLVKVSPCAFWKTNARMPRPTQDFPRTIVLQGELDSQTAWEGGRRTGLQLPRTSFIAIDNESNHGLFPYRSDAVDRPVLDMLLERKQPARITTVQAKPMVRDDAVYESWQHLDGEAKHVGADENNARQPVPNSAIAPATTETDLLAEITTDALRREVVREIYGEAGVAALD